MPTRWVIKLGGSLHDSDHLPRWLEALADAGAVLVPGGGPFAEAVRSAQARWGFVDTAAHGMAILAMRQYGLMLHDLCPKFLAFSDISRLAAQMDAGRAAIWLPDPDAIPTREVPASWAVTSDSLAAWLARKIGADHLLLVKSVEIPAESVGAGQAAAAGWIDAAFPAFLAGGGFAAWLSQREDHANLRQGLRDPKAVFTPIEPDTGPVSSESNTYVDQSPLFREPA